MGPPRRRGLLKSRKRVQDDGEEEGSVATGVEEDSFSEGSAISEADDDADGEGSDGSGSGRSSPAREASRADTVANGHRSQVSTKQGLDVASNEFPIPTAKNDTDVMMNGLQIAEGIEDRGVAFEDLQENPEAQSPVEVAQDQDTSPNVDSLADKRRKEHEEYKRKRDADPAFVPNRGGFFMHDHRSAAPGQNGFRSFGRGRGRGGGVAGRPLQPMNQQPGPVDAPWAHDLHETVAQPKKPLPQGPRTNFQIQTTGNPEPPNRSFSTTTRIGNVQVRVFLAGMPDPRLFSAVPVKQHTRLPHHRPPLRRDKPVRISLPEMPIRYIFPSTDRSFIFIPRALRPNQQGFGRIRGRGSFGAGYSAFGGVSSRRTSAYAGSAYSPSIALSRRSSMVRDLPFEGIVSIGAAAPIKMAPVVRLPPAAEQIQASSEPASSNATLAPTVNLPQSSAYPLPQKPTYRENRPAALPMQHPKPQRTLQVADIDSPATLEFNPPQQQQQLPFHQQVPPQIVGQNYQPDPSQNPHSRHPSHPSQASGGTPLAHIPDGAIHAQPFQPYPYQHPPPFYPQQFPPPVYYYPPSDPSTGGPSIAAPAFVPGQPYPIPMPVAPAPAPAHVPQTQTQTQPEQPTQGGLVAQEVNGMVYYLDPAQIAANTENTPSYPPTGFAVPPTGGVLGMGGMMTPPLYFPAAPAYYPPQ